jgi:hypothetical protein
MSLPVVHASGELDAMEWLLWEEELLMFWLW